MSIELSVELTDIQGDASLTFQIQELSQPLALHSLSVCRLQSVSGEDEVSLTATSATETIGMLKLPVSALFDLSGSALVTRHSLGEVLTFTLSCMYQGPPHCAYLDALGSAEPSDIEKVNEVWSRRNSIKTLAASNSITIAFEPEPVTKADQILDVPSLATLDIQSLYDASANSLKKTIKALADQVNTEPPDMVQMMTELKEKIDARREAHSASEKATLELAQEWEAKDKQLQELLNEKAHESHTLSKQKQYSRELVTALDSLQAQITHQQRVITQNQSKFFQVDTLKTAIDGMQHAVTDANTQKELLQHKIEEARKVMKSILEEAEMKKNKVLLAKQEVAEQLQATKQKNEALSSESAKLKAQLVELKSQLSSANLPQQLEAAHSNMQEEASKRAQVHADLAALEQEIQNSIESFKKTQSALLTSKQKKSQTLHKLEAEIDCKQRDILEYNRKLYVASNNKITLEQLCCIRADLSQQAEDLNKLNKMHANAQQNLMKTIAAGSELLSADNTNVLKELGEMDSLIDSIEAKEQEIDNLKAVMGEVKRRVPPYIPVKEDPIDVALSQYLNSRDKPILVPFTREEEGVYMFGTRRIFLGLECGNIKVRVGGGYSTIDDFIEVYTPIELSHQETDLRDTFPEGYASVSRFNSLPSTGMSPQRASRIIKGTVDAIEHGSPPRSRQSPAKKKRTN